MHDEYRSITNSYDDPFSAGTCSYEKDVTNHSNKSKVVSGRGRKEEQRTNGGYSRRAYNTEKLEVPQSQ